MIPDKFPDRGPLGGLHACLRAAKHAQCLVLSVDVPLVPCSVLSHLCGTHTEDVIVLRHAGKIEPLIGIYDKSLCDVIAQLISNGGVSVQKLADCTAWTFFDYVGPEVFLQNCNTPEEFLKIQAVEAPLLNA
ncbi:molybdenum cofactor guanylyltransferase [uncultured Dysosmobacter sp.]|uniref:molybdenum cofactor guanylyltransferase n=1 Tax=uncultured Dysosmobacter sp. TaxID=2591384 RepID=UPI00345D1B4E